MKEKVYVCINKKWFDENRAKFEENADDEDTLVILSETTGNTETEVAEINEEYGVSINESNKNIWIGIDWKPKADQIVEIVSQEIDNIKGEALAKIIETIVKKLNKFKTLVETIKGL